MEKLKESKNEKNINESEEAVENSKAEKSKKEKKGSSLGINEEQAKENIKKVNKNLKKGTSEFKEFITRGNVVDMAVGVVVGGAFSKIVTSLVNDIIMPLIGILIGGIDFSDLNVTVLNAKVQYGMFIQQVIDFLIISLCIFLFMKLFSNLSKKTKKEEAKEKPKKSNEEVLLEEIRDLLKEKENN